MTFRCCIGPKVRPSGLFWLTFMSMSGKPLVRSDEVAQKGNHDQKHPNNGKSFLVTSESVSPYMV